MWYLTESTHGQMSPLAIQSKQILKKMVATDTIESKLISLTKIKQFLTSTTKITGS